ncbi:hypothetical protein [Paenibacillus sp. PDC88]|uniref:Uncharacterized protein n=1 Tax=Paenibacillus provencensis TaxID=441151 RepID=A0ABW3Q252_9BACL|nr:hypothetical protein [Paenibacillus sp. PDC88]SDX88563.1 hypothetical protein SAMN05518848_12315 [Paenibacillus sp. PDC88]
MRINMNTLKQVLPCQPDGQTTSKTLSVGIFRAIEAAHELVNSSEVDWNSFTLAEAEEALDHAMAYECDEHIEYGDYANINSGNAIHEYLHSHNLIFQLKRSAPEKQTATVQFF